MGGCWGRCFRGLAAFRLGRSAPSLNDQWSRTVFVERAKRDDARRLAKRPEAPLAPFVERAKRDETPAPSLNHRGAARTVR